MRGIVLNTLTLGEKTYKYNDITQGIITSPFPLDKFYGGRVTRFGKTKNGLLLCLEKEQEQVIDIFIDLDALDGIPQPILRQVAEKIKAKKIAYDPANMVVGSFEITGKISKEELITFITGNAVEVLSSKEKVKTKV